MANILYIINIIYIITIIYILLYYKNIPHIIEIVNCVGFYDRKKIYMHSKYYTGLLFDKNNISITKQILLNESINELPKNFKYPIVLKPDKFTTGGKDVYLNISSSKDLHDISSYLMKKYGEVLMEEQVLNLNEYRIMIYNGNTDKPFIDVIKKEKVYVIGDGINTIEYLAKIQKKKYDERLVDINIIPNKNEYIIINNILNTTQGGLYKYINYNHINDSFIDKVCKITNLNAIGIDILCEDINKKIDDQEYYILEINTCPGVKRHINEEQGKYIVNRSISRITKTNLLLNFMGLSYMFFTR